MSLQGDDRIIIQVCPEVSELSEIRTNVKCTAEGCSSVFPNTSCLEMHLIKTHEKKSCYLDKLASNVSFQYFCPVRECKYELSDFRKPTELRCFTKLKLLKQHYLKIHKEKNLKCSSCQRAFSIDKDLQRHSRLECGVSLKCATCNASYKTYTALQTHCKRKNHFYDSSPIRQKKRATTPLKSNLKTPQLRMPGKELPILPNPYPDSVVNIAATALSELSWRVVVRGVEKGVQTDGRRRSVWKSVKKRDSRETQTGEKTARISAETQTTGLFPNKKQPGKARRKEKNSETQTSQNKSNAMLPGICDSPKDIYPLKDIVLPSFWTTRNTSSTQTNACDSFFNNKKDLNLDLFSDFRRSDDAMAEAPPHDNGIFCSDQIDLIDQDVALSSNPIFDSRLCNIETQTEFDFSDTFIDSCPILSNTETQTIQDTIDEYSHNYTQTCDDIFLNDFVEFTDIETQTAWVNLAMSSSFVSAETQTLL